MTNDWPAQDPNTLRLDAIGDVARPFTEAEVHGTLAPLSVLIEARRAPALVLLVPIANALRAGRRPRRGDVVLRFVGPLATALAVALSMDARCAASRRRVHDVLRALPDPAVDALEDLLARFPAIRPLLEAERMHRAGLLREDWTLVLEPRQPAPSGRIAAVVRAPVRAPIADA